VPRTEAGLREFYRFRDFPHFVDVYGAVGRLVREPDDVAFLVLEAARDLAGQNVRYFELTVTPYAQIRAGIPERVLTEALDIAAVSAAERYGIRVAYILATPSEAGAKTASATLDHALSCPPANLVGFGLVGIEQARPQFRDVFRSVFAAGLHSVPRIGHGTSCLLDARLVKVLRDRQVPLEVCPTSNVCTSQVPDLASHPLPRMLGAGLFVTLNSDDPPMFGTTLSSEYARVAVRPLPAAWLDLGDPQPMTGVVAVLQPVRDVLRVPVKGLRRPRQPVLGAPPFLRLRIDDQIQVRRVATVAHVSGERELLKRADDPALRVDHHQLKIRGAEQPHQRAEARGEITALRPPHGPAGHARPQREFTLAHPGQAPRLAQQPADRELVLLRLIHNSNDPRCSVRTVAGIHDLWINASRAHYLWITR
jgi:aminodeoxyfutalosine deaminase